MIDPQELTTELSQGVRVSKAHPRIELRGRLDSLHSEIALCALRCAPDLRAPLEDALSLVANLITADYLEAPVPAYTLMGMTGDEAREASHHPERFGFDRHPERALSQGVDAARLHVLRAHARQVEVCATRAYEGAITPERLGVLRALNRLSSYFYVLALRADARRSQHHREE